MHARRLVPIALVLALGATPALVGGASAQEVRHRGQVSRVDLPSGWQPEGVTTDGERLYVGSLATGRILRANVRTGNTHVLPRSRTDKPAVGVDYDRRRDVIWVAGGDSGEIRAQSSRTGRVLRTYQLPGTAPRFVNDLVVTRRAVYATDSLNQELGVVRFSGRRLPGPARVTTLPLSGDVAFEPGFNANGIVKNGRWLIMVQSNTGLLFRVNGITGRAVAIDAGGYSFANGDGLEADGRRVYVVRNRDHLIAVVKLRRARLSGDVIAELHSRRLDVPTTLALLGHHLWVVNARFGIPQPDQADYWVTRLHALAD